MNPLLTNPLTDSSLFIRSHSYISEHLQLQKTNKQQKNIVYLIYLISIAETIIENTILPDHGDVAQLIFNLNEFGLVSQFLELIKKIKISDLLKLNDILSAVMNLGSWINHKD